MRVVRALTLAMGVGGAGYGLWLLLGLGPDQVGGTLGWALGGVIAHDGLLAPTVVVIGVLVAVHVPALRAPMLWAAVILGPLTLVAVPVLGRFGAKPDNPTLLDRPYWLGYAAIVLLVLAGIGASTLRRVRRSAGAPQRGSAPVDHESEPHA